MSVMHNYIEKQNSSDKLNINNLYWLKIYPNNIIKTWHKLLISNSNLCNIYNVNITRLINLFSIQNQQISFENYTVSRHQILIRLFFNELVLLNSKYHR